MASILEELCYGNINPTARSIRRGTKFDKATGTLNHAAETLYDSLNEEQKKLFESFDSAKDEVHLLERTDQFIYGFRLGMLIAMEVNNVSDDYAVNG